MKIIEITVNTKGQYRIETRGFTVGVIRKELTLRRGCRCFSHAQATPKLRHVDIRLWPSLADRLLGL